MERYKLAKEEQCLQDAVKYLCEMMINTNVIELAQFKNELRHIVNAVRAEERSDEQLFLNSVFNSLTPEYKYTILLRVAQDLTDNWPELCKLMLYTLKLFPNKLKEEGSKLIDIVSRAEATDQSQANTYRKMLMFEVLPLILSETSNFSFESFTNLEWNLLRAFRYYVDSSFLNLTQLTKSDAVFCDEMEMKLNQVMSLAAVKMRWDKSLFDSDVGVVITHADEFLKKYCSSPASALSSGSDDGPMDLSASNSRNQSPEAVLDEESMKEITFSLLFLYLKCLNRYARDFIGKYILVEKFIPGLGSSSMTSSPVPAKKRRLAAVTAISTAPRELITSNYPLKVTFEATLKIIDMLDSNPIVKREFNRILSLIAVDISKAHTNFLVDERFYRAQYEDLIHRSKEISQKDSTNFSACLQIMSASMMNHDYPTALQYSFMVTEMLQAKSVDSPSGKQRTRSIDTMPLQSNTPPLSRQLFFVAINTTDVLAFCIDTMIASLKSMVLLSLRPQDTGVGHLVVLTQYNWPRNVDCFMQCVNAIRAPIANLPTGKAAAQAPTHKFVYPYFTDYVLHPDILEEFMALVSEEKLLLELSPSIVGGRQSSKSMTTRGVNKGAKEEIRTLLIQQMQKWRSELDDKLFMKFITNEMKTTMSSYF